VFLKKRVFLRFFGIEIASKHWKCTHFFGFHSIGFGSSLRKMTSKTNAIFEGYFRCNFSWRWTTFNAGGLKKTTKTDRVFGGRDGLCKKHVFLGGGFFGATRTFEKLPKPMRVSWSVRIGEKTDFFL
jgi:hypothetical protein